MRDHGGVASENGKSDTDGIGGVNGTIEPADERAAEPAAGADGPEPGADDAEVGAEAPDRQRPKTKTVRDMLLSMAVIVAGSFFFFLFLPNDASQDPVRPVEYRVEASSAARAAPYELLAPDGLPEEWRATSVRYQHQGDHGSLWRIGFMDPDNEYVALGQADGSAAAFIGDFTKGAEDSGETSIVDGAEWEYYTGAKYNALVRTDAEATTIVTGTAPLERLEEFAAVLAPATPNAP